VSTAVPRRSYYKIVRDMELLSDPDKIPYIRNYARQLGFLLFFFAGLMQLPALAYSTPD
jgi:hypothetical protein